ncbi:unnamed protein product [Closterium sp. Yama58-4]|nr:unnamed protein product [Closterium sp. Yama58-4]
MLEKATQAQAPTAEKPPSSPGSSAVLPPSALPSVLPPSIVPQYERLFFVSRALGEDEGTARVLGGADGTARVLGGADGTARVLGGADGTARVLGGADGTARVLGGADGTARVLGEVDGAARSFAGDESDEPVVQNEAALSRADADRNATVSERATVDERATDNERDTANLGATADRAATVTHDGDNVAGREATVMHSDAAAAKGADNCREDAVTRDANVEHLTLEESGTVSDVEHARADVSVARADVENTGADISDTRTDVEESRVGMNMESARADDVETTRASVEQSMADVEVESDKVEEARAVGPARGDGDGASDAGAEARDGVECMRCGGEGHVFGECWQPYEPADLARVQCHVCLQWGHLACADLADPPPKPSCCCCGARGHHGEECPSARRFHSFKLVTDSPASRYKAAAAKSPASQLKAAGAGRGSEGRRCFRCGEAGHLIKDCHKSDDSGEDRIKDSIMIAAHFDTGRGGKWQQGQRGQWGKTGQQGKRAQHKRFWDSDDGSHGNGNPGGREYEEEEEGGWRNKRGAGQMKEKRRGGWEEAGDGQGGKRRKRQQFEGGRSAWDEDEDSEEELWGGGGGRRGGRANSREDGNGWEGERGRNAEGWSGAKRGRWRKGGGEARAAWGMGTGGKQGGAKGKGGGSKKEKGPGKEGVTHHAVAAEAAEMRLLSRGFNAWRGEAAIAMPLHTALCATGWAQRSPAGLEEKLGPQDAAVG